MKKPNQQTEKLCNLVDTRTGKIITKNVKLPIWNISLFNRAFGMNNSPNRYIVKE